jgi:hypothetical protein
MSGSLRTILRSPTSAEAVFTAARLRGLNRTNHDESRERRGPGAHGGSRRERPLRTVSEPGRAAVVQRGGFRLITAAFALSSFVSVAVAVHLVKLLVDGGTTPAFAAFAAGLMGLSQIPGRIVFALAASRLGPAATARGVFAFGAVALVSLTVDQSRWAVLAFVVGYGMSNRMTTLLRATVIADLYGQASFGAISGVVSAVTLAVRAAAPFAAALIAVAPGGSTTLTALAAMSVAAAFAVGRGARADSILVAAAAPAPTARA